MANGSTDRPTREHPIDLGIDNAREKIELESAGEFTVAYTQIEELKGHFQSILKDELSNQQIPEEFLSTLFELVALVQFKRIRNGDESLTKTQLVKLTRKIWEIIKEWLKPKPPKS